MPEYTRAFAPSGTFFFTGVTFDRSPIFNSDIARSILHESIHRVRERRPFSIDAFVLLPDHLHCIWTLPRDDHDFSTRWRKFKENFTRRFTASAGVDEHLSSGKRRKGMRGVWQPRFWEHTIRDDRDFRQHADYIHYNPVRHEYVGCPHAWQWSSFDRCVAEGYYEPDWGCTCGGRFFKPPSFDEIADSTPE